MAHLIHDDAEHAAALAELDALLDQLPLPGRRRPTKPDLLALVIEMYEKHRWPFGSPDPVDAILFVMDQRSLSRSDLEEYLGSRSRVSEALARKRGLSIRMIRALHEGLGIPLEVLVRGDGGRRSTTRPAGNRQLGSSPSCSAIEPPVPAPRQSARPAPRRPGRVERTGSSPPEDDQSTVANVKEDTARRSRVHD